MDSNSPGVDLLSSVKQKTYEIDSNSMLCTITLKCKEEMLNNHLYKPLEDYMERVAHYTGLSKVVINQVLPEDLKEIDCADKYFQLKHLIDIFKHIAKMYANQETCTYKNLCRWYKNLNSGITFSQFEYKMTCLGFEYFKTKLEKEIFIEDPALTYERYLYLKQISNFRMKCAPIYYVDERFFDSKYTFSKPWINNVDVTSPTCDGYVFFHAISSQGFLNGLFCSPITKKDFVKWISHILIPLLPGPSVIVMDKNDLHGSHINSITKYHSKDEMLQYLKQKSIPCSEHLHKAELYELISKCTTRHMCYDVDEIFKAHGHHVLRLPTNFHDLSLTHFLWKHFLDSEPDLLLNIELSQIKMYLLEKLTCLPQHLWESFHEELIAIEEDIFITDSKAAKALNTNYRIG